MHFVKRDYDSEVVVGKNTKYTLKYTQTNLQNMHTKI